MAYIPTEEGITDKVLDALLDFLTEKLQTDVPADDASRATTLKVGPRQDDPTAVVVLIHENHPDDPDEWPHRPIPYRGTRRRGGYVRDVYDQPQVRADAGYELVGGGSRMAYAFTIEIEIWGDEVEGLTLTRREVGQIAAVVTHRTVNALKAAGPKIGTGALLCDDFGETIVQGPYWGKPRTMQEEGEALIVHKHLPLYYIAAQEWGTNDW
jgi:hypothetical protein